MSLPAILGQPKKIRKKPNRRYQALGGAPKALDVDLEPRLRIPAQIQNNWCWAAVTEGIWRYYSADAAQPQCQIATRTLGALASPSCCGTSPGGHCDIAYRLDDALKVADLLDRRIDSTLNFNAVVGELSENRPLAVRIGWPDGSGHFVVVSAVRFSPSAPSIVVVQDPFGPKTHTMQFEKLVSDYSTGSGEWTHSYLTTGSPTGGSNTSKVLPSPPPSHDRRLLGG